MKIDHYSFGKIIIDGRTYSSDVVIYPDRVDPSWRRKVGHYLQPADLADAVAAKPEILLVGSGYSGVMVVPDETIKFVRSKGIEIRAAMTGKAVDMFNELAGGKRVVAAFHITC